MGRVDRRRRAPRGPVPRALPAAPRRGAQAPALALADAAAPPPPPPPPPYRRAPRTGCGPRWRRLRDRLGSGSARCRRRHRRPGRASALPPPPPLSGAGAGVSGFFFLAASSARHGGAALDRRGDRHGRELERLVPAAELALAGFGSLPPPPAALPMPNATRERRDDRDGEDADLTWLHGAQSRFPGRLALADAAAAAPPAAAIGAVVRIGRGSVERPSGPRWPRPSARGRCSCRAPAWGPGRWCRAPGVGVVFFGVFFFGRGLQRRHGRAALDRRRRS